MNSAIPLAGGDRIKIVIFFLVLVGTIFFGVIPILIVLAGIYENNEIMGTGYFL